MRCEDARPLLDLRLDGDLPEETARLIDRHLLRCQQCAYEARTLEQTAAMLRAAIPRAAPSPGYRERAAARLADHLRQHIRDAASGEPAGQWLLPFGANE